MHTYGDLLSQYGRARSGATFVDMSYEDAKRLVRIPAGMQAYDSYICRWTHQDILDIIVWSDKPKMKNILAK